jgi:hypothetical protein
MNALLRLALLLMLALIAVGCSRPIVTTGYLDSYKAFNVIDEEERKFRILEEQDFSIDKYFLTKAEIREHEDNGTLPPDAQADGVDLSTGQPILFIINEPQWLAETHLKNKSQEEEVLFVVRERFYRYLLREYPHPVRVRYAYYPDDPLIAGYRVIHLDAAVTHVRKGVGWVRFIIGYGAAATTMQLEGRLREGVDGEKVIGEFVLRDDHAGYPNGFMNPRVMYVHYCLKYAAEEIIGKFSKDLRKNLPAVRPAPAPDFTAPEVGADSQTAPAPESPADGHRTEKSTD